MDRKVTAEELRRKGTALHGSVQQVIDGIMSVKEICGYEDFLFNAWFEHGGFSGTEIEDQMMGFAENVMPCCAGSAAGRPCGRSRR